MGKAPVELNEIDAVQREVDELRERTQQLLAELEKRIESGVDKAKRTVEDAKLGIKRVKHAIDIPAQVREHPRAAAGIGIGTAAAIGLGLWALFAHRRNQRRPLARWKRRAGAYRELILNPEQALKPRDPSLTRKLVTALVVTVATAIVRRLTSVAAQRALPAAPEPPLMAGSAS